MPSIARQLPDPAAGQHGLRDLSAFGPDPGGAALRGHLLSEKPPGRPAAAAAACEAVAPQVNLTVSGWYAISGTAMA